MVASAPRNDSPLLAPLRAFDLICAGEALWRVIGRDQVTPAGGAVTIALRAAREGLSVGVVTSLADDSLGQALAHRLTESGVDVGGLAWTTSLGSLVVVRGDVTATMRGPSASWEIPPRWSAAVTLLAGVTPNATHAAALVRAARAAKRAGSIVVLDLNARRQVWAGHDPRYVRSLFREVDVLRASAEDRAALNLDETEMRHALRDDAVLVSTTHGGDARALGPFGELTKLVRGRRDLLSLGMRDRFTVALCRALTTAHANLADAALWDRALTAAARA